MASVNRRVTPAGSVIYRAIWTEPGPGGTRRKRSKNFERAGEAKAFATRMEQEVEKRGVGDPQKHTLEGFLKRWIATLADRGEHSPTTLAAYRWQSGIACRYIGHIPLEKLSPADLDGLYAMLLKRGGFARKANPDGSRDRTAIDRADRVACASRPVSAALQQAKKWKMIGDNPAKDATAPTPSKSRVKAFTARPGHAIARRRRARCRDLYHHRAVSGLRPPPQRGSAASPWTASTLIAAPSKSGAWWFKSTTSR